MKKDFGSLQSGKTGTADALIIVDMQNGFIGKRSDLVDKIGKLVRSFPPERTWWLKYRNHPDSLFTRHLDWNDVMVAPETDIVPALRPLVRNMIEHSSYSPPPGMAAELKGCREVALAGMDTDACIMATAFYLWDIDIRPLILADYCGSSGGQHCHKAGLDMMRRQFGNGALVNEIVPTRLLNSSLELAQAAGTRNQVPSLSAD